MQVAEAAVIAVSHPKWDERPLLIVVPVEGSQLTASDLLSFLKVPSPAVIGMQTFLLFPVTQCARICHESPVN